MPRSTKRRRRRDAPTPRKLSNFLRHLARTGSVSDAARAIGVSRNTLYRLRRSDEDFALRWDMALDGALDEAYTEATRRAVVGTEQPVFHRGRPVGAIRTYNDKLLMSLLRRHWRHFCGGNSGRISGQNSGQAKSDSPASSLAPPIAPRRRPTAT
ncbi:MAG: hypothetical protein Q8L22_01175 [Reyranella sp.]|nr:hypothetical protein [Reyranella sp.]